MVKIVAAGIGYGNKNEVKEWAMLEPKNLTEFTKQLENVNLNVRHVLGYIPVNMSKPGDIVLVNNPPTDVQAYTTATKGQLGNNTPFGGKVEGEYLDLVKAGRITLDTAYAARGFIGEADEFGPTQAALKILNRIPGLNSITVRSGFPRKDVLSLDEQGCLYVNNRFVRKFLRTTGEDGLSAKAGNIVQLRVMDEDFGTYDQLNEMVVSYSIGLNKVDGKDGKYTATAVANVWPRATQMEIDALNADGELRFEGGKGILNVPLITLGSDYPTTVSNMVACGLLVGSDKVYRTLTGTSKVDVPTLSQMDAFKGAHFLKDTSLEEVVQRFLRA